MRVGKKGEPDFPGSFRSDNYSSRRGLTLKQKHFWLLKGRVYGLHLPGRTTAVRGTRSEKSEESGESKTTNLTSRLEYKDKKGDDQDIYMIKNLYSTPLVLSSFSAFLRSLLQSPSKKT